MNTHTAPVMHWYREPWPWLLMAGPASVILAGIVTVYLAVVTNDGLVADDYYKRGLAINQTLSRDATAQRLGYKANINLDAAAGRVTVTLRGRAPATGDLVLRLAHPGRHAQDRLLPLVAVGEGTYMAAVPALNPGRWQVTLEDAGRTWRLIGDVVLPGRTQVEIAPRDGKT